MYIPFSLVQDSQLEIFKAKFDRDEYTSDYWYYTSNSDFGIPCSEEQYNAYIKEFEESFVINKRILLVWYLVVLPILVIFYIYVQLQTSWVSEPLNSIILWVSVFLPYPLCFKIYWDAYNAPKNIKNNYRGIGKKRNHAQIESLGIRQTSLSILFFAILLCIVALAISAYDKFVDPVLNNHSEYFYLYIIFLAVLCFLAIKKYRSLKHEST